MNYMGARFTAEPAALGPVMEELGRRGLAYFDDGSSARSQAAALARQYRVPFAAADAAIDGAQDRAAILARLGFGRADVVVAVPDSWIDVDTMADLDDVAADFRHRHGRRLRIATKYWRLTQRFFSQLHGIQVYRIVESLGATEGAPAAGQADVIVDITTSGSTLRANRLKVLSDGVILRSEACLAMAKRPRGAADDAVARALAVAFGQ
jgi:ATP phosphoribosyltransferase